jgi:hypothetical protein
VTEGLCEKIAQNVAQPHFCQNECKTLTVENSGPENAGCFCYFQKVNNRPIGENSPNLVTLFGSIPSNFHQAQSRSFNRRKTIFLFLFQNSYPTLGTSSCRQPQHSNKTKFFYYFFFYFASTLSALNYFLFSSLVFANEKEEEEKKLFLSKFRRFDLGTKRPIRGGLGFPELWK